MTYPAYMSPRPLWFDWTAQAEYEFDLDAWADADDFDDGGGATALTSLELIDGGRTLKAVCPDNPSAYAYSGLLRSVASGEFIWAARLMMRRIDTSPSTTSYLTANLCFVDGTALTASTAWYGAGIWQSAAGHIGNNYIRYGSGTRWNNESGIPAGSLWDSALDVLVQRTDDETANLKVWTAKPGHGWTLASTTHATVTGGAALFGVRVGLGNGLSGHDLAVYLAAFRQFESLPM